jgi:hypothetical protein
VKTLVLWIRPKANPDKTGEKGPIEADLVEKGSEKG